jgi:hypothetical protein
MAEMTLVQPLSEASRGHSDEAAGTAAVDTVGRRHELEKLELHEGGGYLRARPPAGTCKLVRAARSVREQL